MSKHTLEQVLEALINKEDDRASELLHQFFVAKGKSIYEELSQFDEEITDEEMDESIGGSPKTDFEDEIIADEEELDDESLFSEAEDDMEDPMAADEEEPTEPEATMDLAAGDDDMSGSAEEKVEQAMDNAEDAFAELKAAFAEIMGDAEGAGDEGSSDMDMPADEEEPTEEGYNAFGESISLKAVSKPTPGDDGENKKSPVSSGTKISSNGAKAIKVTDGNTAGGTTPSSKEINSGNVNKVGNAKAPALKGVSTPKNSDSASNKTSPVAK
jgi:hypothetical protein